MVFQYKPFYLISPTLFVIDRFCSKPMLEFPIRLRADVQMVMGVVTEAENCEAERVISNTFLQHEV